MREICGETIEEVKQAHPTRSIDFEAVGGLRGDWDRDRVEQAISNLIGNAAKHGEDPIGVKIYDEEQDVVVAVHNQGPPISPSVIPTLFEPFTRAAHNVEPREGEEGLGLGLFIASEIARAHVGAVSVSSLVREGTMFALRLPRTMPRRTRATTDS